MMAHMNLLRQHDGLDKVRIQAAETMKNIVQRKIDEIQNQKDCLKAKVFICESSKNKRGKGMPDCGWGCLGEIGCGVFFYSSLRTQTQKVC